MNVKVEDVAESVALANPKENGKAEKRAPAPLYCATDVHILVVDDETPICNLIQGSLTRPNFHIDTVSDVSRIQAQLQERPYHLIILDYVIPGLTPETIFDWIRQDQPDASIIVVTGYPSVDSVLSCLRARTYDYLTKPFELAALERVVRRCLENKGLLRLSEEALRESLGTAIRERRKGLRLTLAQMADRTGISLGYLSQIELGKNSASIETLYRICLALGIKMADLFQVVKS